jgi:hypothetical protein
LKPDLGILRYLQRVSHRPDRIGHKPKKFLLLLRDELAHLGKLHYPGNCPAVNAFGFRDRSFVFAPNVALLNGQDLRFGEIGSPRLCGLAGRNAGIRF